MSSDDVTFPFPAVVGMENAKKALLCSMVNPSIRTVLIEGPPGTAKTLLCRALTQISGDDVVTIPQNSDPERIFGGIDIERTVSSGRLHESVCLLDRADGNIAYIDDINLFDVGALTSILDSVLTNSIKLEREGISRNKPCHTTLVATMNPEEADITPNILDKFDLFVHSSPMPDGAGREETLRRNSDHLNDPRGFLSRYSDELAEMRERIGSARRILPYVTISEDLIQMISELCSRIGAEGHRGDISTAHASIALAALAGRDEVTRKDVEEAAGICLLHRRNGPQPLKERNDDREPGDGGGRPEGGSSDPDSAPREERGEKKERNGSERMTDVTSMEDRVFDVGESFKVIDYLGCGGIRKRTRGRSGRRDKVESTDRDGRHVRSRVPSGPTGDIALAATIRAAAPYQTRRRCEDRAISIEPGDIRERVREKGCGCTVFFLVDASGSIGVRRRMTVVKGAILSMLKDSYIKRDRVGLMAFRRDRAELILPPTKSVEYGYKRLEDLPTGGKTPLSTALVEMNRVICTYSRSHPSERCFVVLVTDGRANSPIEEGSDAFSEALGIAERISTPGVKWIVVDAGMGRMRFDNAFELSRRLSADYFRLEDLDADSLAKNVMDMVG